MLSEKMQAALNDQINSEFNSSYLYLSMVAYFENINLRGFAHWMKIQYEEEVCHGMKFFQHIVDRGSLVKLQAIALPQNSWSSPLVVMQDVLAHEQKVSCLIYKLVDLAGSEKDHATFQFLQWFIAEQVEEESVARSILERVKMVGESKGGLLYIDKELAKRAGASSSS